MNKSTDLPDVAAPEAIAMDFTSLRHQGVALLQRLAGHTWTDHNTHDPGITILEQLCYALSDLGYRAQYALPDLLTSKGENPYADLPTPAQILPTSPVTLTDLRKLVIDVGDVRNAWIHIVDEPAATFNAALCEVSALVPGDAGPGPALPGQNVFEIRLRGLYRVQIEKADRVGIDVSALRREAARRLHRCRGLGTDFLEITVLNEQPIRLGATLEIDAVGDTVALLASVYQRIADYLSPAVPFRTLTEMLERGWRVDEIFEGPMLQHGFIDSKDLARAGRRSSLRISDLIRVLMAVPGVVTVKNLHFLNGDGTRNEDWLLKIDPDKVARFDLGTSDIAPDTLPDIRLERRGLRVDKGIQAAARNLYFSRLSQVAIPLRTAAQERDLRPRLGRDRGVANYYSVQEHFPVAYGIGPAGLPPSAPPERKARVKQLKAYLMFYDQLLANHFAQLANVGKLLSFHDETFDSYFSQPVQDDGTLGLDGVLVSGPDEYRAHLRRITEDPWEAGKSDRKPGVRRRNRFLDHLLARFGEQFQDYAQLRIEAEETGGMTPDERLARDKRAFLRDCARIGRDRGTAFNYIEPTAVGSSQFLPGDFRDVATLMDKLTCSLPDRLSVYLWGQLPRKVKTVLRDLHRTRDEWTTALIAAFNQCIEGVSIYEAARFATIELSEETGGLLRRVDNLARDDLTRLNRLLLEDAYPDEIYRSRDAKNISGLELRLRRKLGVCDGDERFYLVEHILLRPIPGDLNQHGPLLRAARVPDPYSLQISLVFPDWPERYQSPTFRAFVEQTIQEETPAHLVAKVVWKNKPEMRAFAMAYGEWLHQWRNYRSAELGL